LVRRLREAGHDALHTLDLPGGNRTTDAVINDLSARERYIAEAFDSFDYIELDRRTLIFHV